MALNQDLNSIVAYANSESVKINFKEFLLHTQNHPDCPTILAITDTLSFFNINGVMRLASSEIELLPERFIAF